jgi:SagB-type dehydrogenase family enzyme
MPIGSPTAVAFQGTEYEPPIPDSRIVLDLPGFKVFSGRTSSDLTAQPEKSGQHERGVGVGCPAIRTGIHQGNVDLGGSRPTAVGRAGVTSSDGKRTAPSAMHRHPLEIVVVAQNVDGLPSGAYRYWPANHSLERLTAAKPGAHLLASSSAQAQLHSAPAVFVVAAAYERMGLGARKRTWTDYEAGLASENLLLEAVALGLGAVVTGGIDPASVKEAVKFAGDEQVIVVIPVGHPAR